MQQSTGTGIAGINEVNEPMSKCSLNGINWHTTNNKMYATTYKSPSIHDMLRWKLFNPNLIVFPEFQHRLCTGLQCGRPNGRANACRARRSGLHHS